MSCGRQPSKRLLQSVCAEPRRVNVCLVDALRSLAVPVPYASDGPLFALRDGNAWLHEGLQPGKCVVHKKHPFAGFEMWLDRICMRRTSHKTHVGKVEDYYLQSDEAVFQLVPDSQIIMEDYRGMDVSGGSVTRTPSPSSLGDARETATSLLVTDVCNVLGGWIVWTGPPLDVGGQKRDVGGQKRDVGGQKKEMRVKRKRWSKKRESHQKITFGFPQIPTFPFRRSSPPPPSSCWAAATPCTAGRRWPSWRWALWG